jgi:hypothetical protein
LCYLPIQGRPILPNLRIAKLYLKRTSASAARFMKQYRFN